MVPIKQNFPNRLLYKCGDTYKMFSTNSVGCKKGAFLGDIKLSPEKNDVYISHIRSFYPQNKELKVGTSLINFAKNMSRKLNLGGRLRVIAMKTKYDDKDPHKFYFKQGFRAKDNRQNEMLKFTMDYDIDIPYQMKQGLEMFFDPKRGKGIE